MRYRERVSIELQSLKRLQHEEKAFRKRQQQINKWIAREKRPRDKIGRAISKMKKLLGGGLGSEFMEIGVR